MKTLLIAPNYLKVYSYVSEEATMILPPLGLAYIGGYLRHKEIPTQILDLAAMRFTDEQEKEAIKQSGAEFVAIAATTNTILEAYALAKKAKEVLPNCKVAVGGPHPTMMPERTLQEFPEIDYCIVSEAEETTLELAQGKKDKDILGIAYRDNKGNVKLNAPRVLIPNLDVLPFPARDLLPMHKYFSFEAKKYPIDYVVSGRGCPYRCIFCADFITSGRKMRARSAANIVKEIQYLSDTYGTQEIDFQDDNFTLYPERVREFCDLMIKTGLNKKVVWKVANGVRCDKLSLPMLKHMKEAGCYMLSLGIESGNQEILNKMRKAEKLEDISNAAKWCYEAGINARGLFIFGLLGENRKTMEDTINFAKTLPLDTATFHVCIPMPKTEYWEIIKREGQLLDVGWDKYTAYSEGAFKHGEVTPELMSEMQKKAYKEFYLRPSFIIRRFLRIRTAKDVKLIAKGGMEVLKFAKN